MRYWLLSCLYRNSVTLPLQIMVFKPLWPLLFMNSSTEQRTIALNFGSNVVYLLLKYALLPNWQLPNWKLIQPVLFLCQCKILKRRIWIVPESKFILMDLPIIYLWIFPGQPAKSSKHSPSNHVPQWPTPAILFALTKLENRCFLSFDFVADCRISSHSTSMASMASSYGLLWWVDLDSSARMAETKPSSAVFLTKDFG